MMLQKSLGVCYTSRNGVVAMDLWTALLYENSGRSNTEVSYIGC